MIELKPCPFCGNHGAHDKNCYLELYFNSEVLGENIPWNVMAKAWNTRAERTCIEKECANAGDKCSWCVRNYFADNYEPKAVS